VAGPDGRLDERLLVTTPRGMCVRHHGGSPTREIDTPKVLAFQFDSGGFSRRRSRWRSIWLLHGVTNGGRWDEAIHDASSAPADTDAKNSAISREIQSSLGVWPAFGMMM
jgi:hypothetical protein